MPESTPTAPEARPVAPGPVSSWLSQQGFAHEDLGPDHLGVEVLGIDADALVAGLPELAISTGSACSAGAIGISHVLAAIASAQVADGTIRIGFGRQTTTAEVDTMWM